MNAVYPLLEDNKEIHYSIECLKKFTTIGDIFTIGAAHEGAIHIPHTDNQSKIVNLWQKCYAACIDERISDPFLFINDDHFIIKPVDIENYPNYYSYNITHPYAGCGLLTVNLCAILYNSTKYAGSAFSAVMVIQ